MPTCIFAAHAGPSGAKLGGVTKAHLLVRASAVAAVMAHNLAAALAGATRDSIYI